jgi:hypothetical protein
VKLLALTALGFALVLSGCNLLQAIDGGSGGAAATTTTTAGTGAAQGIDCGVDPDTSATLCLGISLCPGLTVDQEVFPQCGFRLAGPVVDVECSCGGYLCPLGSTTCADATTLLAQQNEGLVCAELTAGGCVEGVPQVTTTTSAAATTSSTSGGTCTQDCIGDCDGEPVCLQACGC